MHFELGKYKKYPLVLEARNIDSCSNNKIRVLYEGCLGVNSIWYNGLKSISIQYNGPKYSSIWYNEPNSIQYIEREMPHLQIQPILHFLI